MIAAGIVSCCGRGGDGSASDNASDVADDFVNNNLLQVQLLQVLW